MGFLLRICFRVWKCRTEKQERNRKRNCGSLWAAVFLVKEHKDFRRNIAGDIVENGCRKTRLNR